MRIIGAVCCVIAFAFTKNVEAQKKEVLSSFCQLSLSGELKQSNTSFTDGFAFKIDQNGKPFDVKRILGKYVEEEEVRSCLGEWKFSGFVENSRVSVYFSWKHGVGWTYMRMISKDFSQVVVKGSKSCPDSPEGEFAEPPKPDEDGGDFSDYKRLKEPHALYKSAVKKVNPVYPPAAKSVSASRKVVVRILVSKKGDVAEACVIEGHPLLRAASLEAAKQWKFKKDFGFVSSKLKERFAEADLTFNFELPE